MASIARINVDFVARTGDFDKGAKKIQDGMKNLGRGARLNASVFGDVFAKKASLASRAMAGFSKGASVVRGAVTAMGPALKFAGAGFAAVGAAAMAGFMAVKAAVSRMVETMKGIDDVADAAGRLGDTTANLIGLSLAFELTGGDAEGAQKALEFMNKTIGKAILHGGKAEETFTRLGLSARRLAEMAPTDALKLISDRLHDLPNNATKTAAAIEIFGKSAQDSMSSLTGGGKAIEEFQREAEELGLTISEVEAAEVGAAVDAIGKLERAAGGAMKQLAVAWAPVIEAGAELGIELAKFVAIGTKEALPMLREVGAEVIRNFTLLEVGIKNFENIWVVAISRVQLQVELLSNDIKHALTDFRQMLKIAANPLEWRAKGMPLNFDRESTQKEKALASLIAQNEKSMQNQFQSLLSERLKRPVMEEAGKTLGLNFGRAFVDVASKAIPAGMGSEIFDTSPKGPLTEEELALKIGGILSKPSLVDVDVSKKKEIATPDSPAAIMRGSAEAMNAVAKAQSGTTQQLLNKIAEQLKKLNGTSADTLDAIEDDFGLGDMELVLP